MKQIKPPNLAPLLRIFTSDTRLIQYILMVLGVLLVFGCLIWGIPTVVALAWDSFFVRFGAPVLDYGGACSLIFWLILVYSLILGWKEVK